MIELYGLEVGQARIRYLIPYGSELEPLFAPGPVQVEGWTKLVDALKRELDLLVEHRTRQWARAEKPWTGPEVDARIAKLDDEALLLLDQIVEGLTHPAKGGPRTEVDDSPDTT